MTPRSLHLHRWPAEAGSTLLLALLSLAILAMISAAALYQVANRHATTYHSASWNEALASAEAGADAALLALNSSVTSTNAWTGWTQADGSASNSGNATVFPKTFAATFWTHGGEGNTKVYAKVRVDNAITDGNGTKWMRVRSTGVAEIAHAGLQGIEGGAIDVATGKKSHLSALRKLHLSSDLTGGALRLPQVARSIEVMAQPPGSSLYPRALTVKTWIGMSGSAYTDSFDSGDPNKSTNGLYDVTKRQSHGDIASNSTGSISDLKNTYVYGNASSNGGAIANTTNVTGSVFNNFSTVIPPVPKPNLPSINVNPSIISNPTGGMTLTGGPVGSPQNYKVSALTISQGSNPLILAPSAPGVESYINIWVTGKTTISGSGFIQQQPNVHVNIYSEGDITVSGSGILNQTNVAANLQVFGVDPPSGGTAKATVSGSANFIGVLNAPQFDLTISGTGSFSGAVIGLTATISGSGGFHYDEALSRLGGASGSTYTYASWVEDIR